MAVTGHRSHVPVTGRQRDFHVSVAGEKHMRLSIGTLSGNLSLESNMASTPTGTLLLVQINYRVFPGLWGGEGGGLPLSSNASLSQSLQF